MPERARNAGRVERGAKTSPKLIFEVAQTDAERPAQRVRVAADLERRPLWIASDHGDPTPAQPALHAPNRAEWQSMLRAELSRAQGRRSVAERRRECALTVPLQDE